MNAQEIEYFLITNANAQMKNHFGMVKNVLPVELELHLIQAKINVIIAHKGLLEIKEVTNANQDFEIHDLNLCSHCKKINTGLNLNSNKKIINTFY